jgi:hypothetical protein
VIAPEDFNKLSEEERKRTEDLAVPRYAVNLLVDIGNSESRIAGQRRWSVNFTTRLFCMKY